MNRNRLALAALALVALLGIGCGNKSEKAVAVIGDRKISAGELLLLYSRITPPNRPPFETLDEKKAFLNIVVSKELLVQEAKKQGLDKSPETVEKVKVYRDQELTKRVYTEIAQKPVVIDAAELEQYYNKTQAQYNVRDIWIVGPKSKADGILREIRGGLDFAKAAEKYSENEYKAKGGDIGWHTINDPMLAFFRDSLATMKEGDVSEPIPVLEGFHIIQLASQKPADMAEFEAKKITVRSEFRQTKENQIWKKHLADMRASKNLAPVPDNIQLVRDRTKATEPGATPQFSESEQALPIMTYTGGSWTIGEMVTYLNAVGPQFRPDFANPEVDVAGWATNRVNSKMILQTGEELGLDKISDFQQMIDRKTEELSLDALHHGVVEGVTVPEDEIHAYYESKRDSLQTPPGGRVRFIYATTEARAESAKADIAAGKPFADAVKRWSEDEQTRNKGGLIDSILQGQFGIPEFDEAVFALNEGEVSRALVFNNGFYIFRMEEKKPGRPLTYDEAKEGIKTRLLGEAQTKTFDAWLEQKRAAAKIQINDNVLNSISPEESGG